jgi:hypothetical protein
MSTRAFGVAAALAFVLAISLPRCSSAQDVSGVWDGAVTYSVDQFQGGLPVGSTSGAYFGQMSLDYSPSNDLLSMSIGQFQITGYQFFDPFGPDSATGTVFGDYSPGFPPYPVGNYSVDYTSVLPDGPIDVSGGFAAGDLFIDTVGEPGTGEVIFASFQTVPEPASVALAGVALLIVGVAAWMRRVRPQPSSQIT